MTSDTRRPRWAVTSAAAAFCPFCGHELLLRDARILGPRHEAASVDCRCGLGGALWLSAGLVRRLRARRGE